MFSLAIKDNNYPPIDPNTYYSEFSGADFNDLKRWNIVNPHSNSLFSSCGNDKILGGFGIFGAKTTFVKKVAVPPHKAVTLRFNQYLIDSWE